MPHKKRISKNLHITKVEEVKVELPFMRQDGANRHYIRKASSFIKRVFKQFTMNRAKLRYEQQQAREDVFFREKQVAILGGEIYIGRPKPLNGGMYKHVKGVIQKD